MTVAQWLAGAGPDAVIVQGDCRSTLATMADGCVDAVVTDPPWNLGKAYGRHHDAMPRDGYLRWLSEALDACRRVSRTGVFFFAGEHNLADLPDVLDRAGLHLAGLTWWVSPPPAARREPIASAVPGPGSGGVGEPAVDRPIVAVDADPYRARHPCPKPVPVLAALMQRHVPEGGTVLDPFAGTGSTVAAALRSGRRALGIELEPRFCRSARERVTAGG